MRCGCLESTAVREADLGEALTGAANGIVTAEAKARVRARAASRSRRFPRALFLRPCRRAGRAPEGRGGALARSFWPARRRMRPGSDLCASRCCASIRAPRCRRPAPVPRHRMHRARARPMSPRQARCRPSSATPWCAAWWRGSPSASSRTVPTSKAGCGCCAPIWCSATRSRRAHRPATRGARSKAMPDGLRRLDDAIKGLGLEG